MRAFLREAEARAAAKALKKLESEEGKVRLAAETKIVEANYKERRAEEKEEQAKADKARAEEQAKEDAEKQAEMEKLPEELRKPFEDRWKKERKKAVKRRKAEAKVEEERRRVLAIFEQYDVDCSGTLDAEEFQMLLDDLCIPTSEKERRRIIRSLDVDGNGAVEFDEFMAFYNSKDNKMRGKTKVKLKLARAALQGKRFLRVPFGGRHKSGARRAIVERAKLAAREVAKREFVKKRLGVDAEEF